MKDSYLYMSPYSYTCKKFSASSAMKYLEAGLTKFTISGIIKTVVVQIGNRSIEERC